MYSIWKNFQKKNFFITQKFSIVSYAYFDIVYIFIKYLNSSFTLIYWNCHVIKNVTYFKDIKKYFIRIQCSSMLLSIKEILLYNFLCEFKYNSCIVLIFKLKTYKGFPNRGDMIFWMSLSGSFELKFLTSAVSCHQ